jgi:hypothetical protein
MKLRLSLLTLTCGIALLAGPSSARTATTIRVAERSLLTAPQIYDPAAMPSDGAYRLTLTLVYFTDGNWSYPSLLRIVRAAGEILSQCGLALRQLAVVRVDAPRRYRYFDTPISRELARALQLSKPTVYFVTDTLRQPAFDAEAIGRANSGSRPELADTVWLTHGTRDPGIALAHELVHVLSDSGAHSDLPRNLMRDRTAPDNTRLTIAQCARLRDVGAASGLLQRR